MCWLDPLTTETACGGIWLELEIWVLNSGQRLLPSQLHKPGIQINESQQKAMAMEWCSTLPEGPCHVWKRQNGNNIKGCNRQIVCFCSFSPARLIVKLQQGSCWAPHSCLSDRDSLSYVLKPGEEEKGTPWKDRRRERPSWLLLSSPVRFSFPPDLGWMKGKQSTW